MKFAFFLVLLPFAAPVAFTGPAEAADLDGSWGAPPHHRHHHHRVWREVAPAPAAYVAPLPSLADLLVLPLETPPPELLVHHDRPLPPGVIYNVPVEPLYLRGPVIRANY